MRNKNEMGNRKGAKGKGRGWTENGSGRGTDRSVWGNPRHAFDSLLEIEDD